MKITIITIIVKISDNTTAITQTTNITVIFSAPPKEQQQWLTYVCTYTHTHMHIHSYIHIYIYVHACIATYS